MYTIYSQWNASIARRYGRKQGWLRHHIFGLIQHLGGYQHFKRVNWNQVVRLVFVCKGNVCRSPYGEVRARALGIPASSFGLLADDHSSVHPTALKVGYQRGLDLSAHRSRSRFPLLSGDLLIAMEPWQGKQLQRLQHRTDVQITLLGLWHSQPRPHIEDPYGLGKDYFETCFAIIDDAIQHIVDQMKMSYVR
jgi:protein-tyrosine phosphatase